MASGEPSTSKSSVVGEQALNPGSRVYFPAEEQDAYGTSDAEGSSKPSLIGLGPPPHLRRSSANDDHIPTRHDHGRRRVRSAHVTNGGPAGSHPAQRYIVPGSTGLRKRTMTGAPSSKAARLEKGVRNEAFRDDSSFDAFSDEYELAHEDPQLLEDVQRALKLKVRREARVQAMRASGSPYSSGSSISRSVPGSAAPTNPRMFRPSIESEVDFSPSVGIDLTHPVPVLLNDGATLDWRGASAEEDKGDSWKWSLSISKRKAKDKDKEKDIVIGGLTREELEQQESAWLDRLKDIKVSAKAQTLKKAQITREQLRRRYAQLDTYWQSKSQPLNPLRVVRWSASIDPIMQRSVDQAEPMAWLKHLRDRRRGKTRLRSPWYLTALIVEEYVKNQARRDTMETIPEDPSSSTAVALSSQASSPSTQGVPSYMPSLDNTSENRLEASLSRRRSLEEHVSFEPSGRRSLGGDSGRSLDAARGWKNAQNAVDSPRSSIYSSIFGGSNYSHPPGGASPSSSRRHLRDIVSRRVRRHGNDSDDASSSHQEGSMSEGQNRSDDGGTKSKKRRYHFRPPELDLFARANEANEATASGSMVDDSGDLLPDPMGTSKSPSASDDPLTAKVMSTSDLASRTTIASPAGHVALVHRLRGFRTSLPSSERSSLKEESQRLTQADERREEEEYDRKVELLENTIAQNQRNRQLLQRIAAGVKEYEAVQGRMTKALGHSYVSLPADLLDAFSHDPAVVTGSTRWLRGWRAVENIHEHIQSQVETVQSFLLKVSEDGKLPPQHSLLDNPISVLMRSLDVLEDRRAELAVKAAMVEERLNKVKATHASVKAQFNETLGHVSSVYPEVCDFTVIILIS
ncbi:hypothetical protein EWM64_g4558 [Hericium alpestre]|uniref:Uncharacterized protein n=1 Tax=Hericium alpestre TaxID=135208 RepID=A0A4Y9ZZ37_9AGAM|nr:hypothetical protein EWM64_g4558 [Hericium alpestre]